MTVFWAIALIGGVLIVAALGRPLLARGRADATEAPDIAVYRDQLAEAERDLERGVLTAAEAAAVRTEVSRRLLAAADAAGPATQAAPHRLNTAMAAALAVVVIGGTLGLYARYGAPGLPDQPLAGRLADEAARRADRPSQQEAEAFLAARPDVPGADAPDSEQMALIAQLQDILKDRPDDLRGHRLLAENLGRLGQYTAAHAAQGDVLRILGDAAQGEDYADLAEYLILAVNGYVSPQAEAALVAALARNPAEPRARYYSGLAALQAGRADLAHDLWTRLLADSPPDAPWVGAINAQLAEVAAQAGRAAPRGPGAADLDAAADMTAQEREDMVRSMVAGLADRLATEGGPAEDWARLIRAYGVLGQTDRADAIWREARETFAADADAMTLLQGAARAAGVAP